MINISPKTTKRLSHFTTDTSQDSAVKTQRYLSIYWIIEVSKQSARRMIRVKGKLNGFLSEFL